MPNYTVHLPEDSLSDADVADKSLFVKDGFAVFGFVLTGFWLVSHRLWLLGLGYFVLIGLILTVFILYRIPLGAFSLVQALLALLIGLEGHEWVRGKLARRGFRQVAVVSGSSLEECERRFFADWLSRKPPSSPPADTVAPLAAKPAQAPTVLGLFPAPNTPAPRSGA